MSGDFEVRCGIPSEGVAAPSGIEGIHWSFWEAGGSCRGACFAVGERSGLLGIVPLGAVPDFDRLYFPYVIIILWSCHSSSGVFSTIR